MFVSVEEKRVRERSNMLYSLCAHLHSCSLAFYLTLCTFNSWASYAILVEFSQSHVRLPAFISLFSALSLSLYCCSLALLLFSLCTASSLACIYIWRAQLWQRWIVRLFETTFESFWSCQNTYTYNSSSSSTNNATTKQNRKRKSKTNAIWNLIHKIIPIRIYLYFVCVCIITTANLNFITQFWESVWSEWECFWNGSFFNFRSNYHLLLPLLRLSSSNSNNKATKKKNVHTQRIFIKWYFECEKSYQKVYKGFFFSKKTIGLLCGSKI